MGKLAGNAYTEHRVLVFCCLLHRRFMPAVYDKLGIRFNYPENWRLDESEALEGAATVTVYTTLGKEMKVVLDNALTFMAYGDQGALHLKRGLIAPRLDWSMQSHTNARRKRKSAV